MNEKFNKNAKVEQLNKMFLGRGEEKGLIVKGPFILRPLVSLIQIKVLINDLAFLLDLTENSEGTKLLIWTVIFCLVFTPSAKWRVELWAKIGQYRNRCFIYQVYSITDLVDSDYRYEIKYEIHSSIRFNAFI